MFTSMAIRLSLLFLALLPAPADGAEAAAAAPDSLPAASLAILRSPDEVTLDHRANRRVPATFVSKMPSWRYTPLGSYVWTLKGEPAASLMASLQIERWFNPTPPSAPAPCGDPSSRREDLTLTVVRGRDTTWIDFDLARGTVLMFRTGEPHRGARVGRESKALLKSLADAFQRDPLLLGIQPCERDAPLDSSSQALADIIDVRPDGVPKALKPVAPKYPKEAAARNLEGTVIVRVLVGTDGRVRETLVVRPNPVFDEAAVLAVEQWTFLPALAGDKPVATWVALPVKFTLR